MARWWARTQGQHRGTTNHTIRERALALLVTPALLIGMVGLAAVSTDPAAQAAEGAGDDGLSVSKDADANVLVGDTITYTLTAKNTSETDAYNLSFRDVLPAGVKHASTEGQVGAPETYPVKDGNGDETGEHVLIWSNVSDLPAGASKSLTFTATPDADKYPVGETVENTAEAFANDSERDLTSFVGGDYAADKETYDVSGESGVASTDITAIKIEKSEPSDEHELLRGVHDQTTVYTLEVTNNSHAATNDVEVVDYLPAGLEFLGCREADNTTDKEPEYSDAPSLKVPGTVDDCVEADSVKTVKLKTGEVEGLDAGVYTMVTWSSVPNLAKSDTYTIKYAAGIPQRENVMWDEGSAPTAESGEQAANLDNNTGASTREGADGDEQSLTNVAEVNGTYTGKNNAGVKNTDVSDSDSVTVTAEDLALQKSVAEGSFDAGSTIDYTLTVRASEYVDASAITITDTLLDGLCLAGDGTNDCVDAEHPGKVDVMATYGDGGNGPAVSVDSIDRSNAASGESVVTFKFDDDEFELTANKVLNLTYSVFMRSDYRGEDQGQAPTVSGDSFTNHAALTGTTKIRTDIDVEAPEPKGTVTNVTDKSQATISADAPTLTKTILPNTVDGEYKCDASGYVDNDVDDGGTAATDNDLTFQVGDWVCFTVRVDFSDSNKTKNPVITDFLPSYLEYESATATDNSSFNHENSSNNVTFAEDSGVLTWTLGSVRDGSTSDENRYVESDAVFEYRIAAKVTQTSTLEKPDLTGNLAKLTWTNTENEVGFLRDKVDFSIASIPPVLIDKAVTRDGDAIADDEVASGDVLNYTLTVTNDGSTENRNALDMTNIAVWDVLPEGIACNDVSAISDLGTCAGSDPSTITWTLDGPLAAEASTDLTYTVTVPEDPRVDTTYTNTAGVRSFETTTNIGDPSTHYPKNNIDPSVDADDEDVPEARDDTSVHTVDAALTKTQTTGVEETNNDADSQATIGETVTYTVIGTIPAHSTVYRGTITDSMPDGIKLLDASAMAPDGSSIGSSGEPSLTVTPGAGSSGSFSLDLGAQYVNSTSADQVFTITVDAQVSTAASNTHDTKRENTATFERGKTSDEADGTLPDLTDSTVTTIVEPSITLDKTDGTGGNDVAYGDVVTYTLTAENATGHSPLHDGVVVDCVPAGLQVQSGTLSPAGTILNATDTGYTCTDGATQVQWNLASSLTAGSPQTFSYHVKVNEIPAGNEAYKNTAELTGYSLDAAAGSHSDHRSYSDTASDTVTVVGATLTKTTSTLQRAIGDEAEFTVTATLPEQVNFYDVTLIDSLPNALAASSLAVTDSTCTTSTNVDCSADLATNWATPSTSGQTVTWSLGDVTAQTYERTVTVTYTATVAEQSANEPSAGDTLTNGVQLHWNKVSGDNHSSTSTEKKSADVTVTEPSLSISKKVNGADADTPAPGDVFTYTVTVTNDSGTNVSTAHEAVITDDVPAGVVVDTATISNGGTYDSGTRTITWTVTSLAAGDSEEFTYDASLAGSAGTPTSPDAQTNTVSIDSYCSVPFDAAASETCANQGGRDYTGPSADAKVTPDFPHVKVSKTTNDGSLAYLDQSHQFTITITSDGKSAAHSVSAVDVLPVGWEYDAASARVSIAGATSSQVEPAVSGTASAGQTLTWSATNSTPLAVNDTIVITYSATPQTDATPTAVDDDGTGHEAQTNTVSVTAEDANGNETDAEDNGFHGPDADETVYIDMADVVVAKAVDQTPVAGKTGSWTITVSNDGPDTAVGPFTVLDDTTPPEGITLTGASGDGWTCEAIDASHQTVNCVRTDTSDTLADGASFDPITVTYSVAADVADGTAYHNTATVSGAKTYDPETTPDGDNDSDDATATVTTVADLGIAKTLSSDSFVAGENAEYEIVLHNYGPSDSQGAITVEDAVPAGTTFVSASGTDWTCTDPTSATGTLSCDYVTLPAGGDSSPLTVTVLVDADRTAEVINTATITDTTTSQGDNTHSDESTVKKPLDTSADLAIVKSHDVDDTFVPGTQVHYTLEVTNNGPSAAHAAQVTDTLPSNLTNVSVEGGTDWTCAYEPSTTTVTCDADSDLAPEAEIDDITIVATIDSSLAADTEIANIAEVSSKTPDPNDENDSSTDTKKTGDPSADLALTKSHTGSFTAGETGEYSFTVENLGDSDAVGPLTVSDTLPEGMAFVSASGADWLCTFDTTDPQAVECQNPNGLTTGEANSDLTITVAVAPDAPTGEAALTNSAVVESPTNDPDDGNNTSNDPTDINAEADLQIEKTGPTEQLNAGDKINWTITVTNNGPSVSASTDENPITVTDVVPEWISDAHVVLPEAWFVEGGPTFDAGEQITLTYRHDQTLKLGESVEFSVTGTIDSDIPGDTRIINTAAVAPGETVEPDDPGDTNNESTTGTTPGIYTELGITKTRQVEVDGEWTDATSDNPVVPGESVTYLVTVSNDGGADARNVSITDTVEQYLTYASFESVTGDWSRTSTTADAGDDQTFSLADNLVAGQSATLRVTFDIDSAYDDVVENAVQASADNSTNDPTDEDSSDANRRADLTIAKSHTGEAVAGSDTPLDYTLVVTNNGPSESGGPITVEDTLPAGFSYVRDSATIDLLGLDAEPEIDDQTLTWTIDDDTLTLGPGDSYAITYKVVVASDQPAGTYVNGAEVNGPDDTDPSNNTATDDADVNTSADLQIVKSAADGPYVAGESVSYTLTVTNDGPSLARMVAVKDAVPAGMTLTDLTGDGWDCTVEAGLCSIAELPVGESTITATALVDDGVAADTALTNTATVDAATPDPNDDNNSDDETIDTSVVADLVLDKQAVASDGETATDVVTAGESAGYLFTVRNEGPSTAHGPVQVTDTLPDGMTFAGVGADSGGWACSVDDADDAVADGDADAADAQSVTCELDGDVAAGESASGLVVLVDVADDLAEGDLTNTASVNSSSPESNTDNNSDEATVSVEQHSDLAVTKRHDDDAVAIDQSLAFTLDVVNNGASVATGVTVTDEIPAGLDYVGAESGDSAWNVETTENDDGTTTVTAVLDGSLAVGEHAPALEVTTTVTADAYPSVANVATVGGDQADDKPLNNIFADTVTVPPASTLVLSKEAVGDFQAGSEAHYLIAVTNEGPTEDPGPITVIDDLPEGMAYVDADSRVAACEADHQEVTCTLDGTLGVDETAEISLIVSLNDDASSTISNTAGVLSQTTQRGEAVLGATATASVAAAPTGALPPTGSVLPIGIGVAAIVLLGGGLVLVLVARRRRRR